MTAADLHPLTSAPVMDRADAERLTNRITLMAGTIREGLEKVASLVEQAREGQAHVALGYPSWTAYLADVLGKQPIRLGPDERRELVAYLAGEGMSTRAIAPIVGVAHKTVARDLAPVSDDTPASPVTVDTETGEITETTGAGATSSTPNSGADEGAGTPSSEPPAPVPVTGLDGKTYSRPAAPRVPKPRTNIPASITTALVQVDTGRRALEALTAAQLRSQDEEARSRWAANLSEQIDALHGVLARLTKEANR